MSLLNDSLKRASQSDRNRQLPAQPQIALKPVAGPRGPAEKRGSSWALALGTGSVVALGLAGWFFWQLWGASHALAPAPVVAAKPMLEPVIRADNPPPPTVTESPPLAVPIPAPALPAKPVEDSWPVHLKLTGIFFRKTNPLAIINGKTVGMGDTIDGVRVIKIENDRLTLESNGKVKEIKVNDGGI